MSRRTRSSARPETLRGSQAQADTKRYRVWQKTDTVGGPAGKYLVDDSGAAVWLVDPGINGAFKTRPDGTEVRKFDAPKATLMSYIIKGMLDRKLPWGAGAVRRDDCRRAGTVRRIVAGVRRGRLSADFVLGAHLRRRTGALAGGPRMRHALREHKLDETALAAESDKSPGVLLASGYIAGGAIAGIIIAFVAGVLGNLDARITKWAEASNPFFAGPNADWLALIPFVALAGFLYVTGRQMQPPPDSLSK